MKKTVFLLALMMLVATTGWAQTDTIFVEGTVYNLHTHKPEPYCLVQLEQEGKIRLQQVSDDKGTFFIDALPIGTYTIRVGIANVSLFQKDFDLFEPTNLSIMVDTVRLVNLSPVTITSQRSNPSSPSLSAPNLVFSFITSPDDPRLWNFYASEVMDMSGPACADLSKGTYSDFLEKEYKKKRQKFEEQLWDRKPTPFRKRRLRKSQPSTSDTIHTGR